jgi:hypothetical protein
MLCYMVFVLESCKIFDNLESVLKEETIEFFVKIVP